MPDKKKNRFGADPFYCPSPSKEQADEAMREAIKEAHYLDDNEDSLKWRFNH